jgi:hydrogenase maturation protease
MTTISASRSAVVQVLVCGSADRGDDAAPAAAAQRLTPERLHRMQFRLVGQLDVDHLLAVPRGAAAIVVDTAVGIVPGRIVVLPLNGLIGRGRIRPRSSHALAIPEVVGVADVIRGRPLRGAVIVVGGSRFGLGDSMSDAVARHIPALAAKVVEVANLLRSGAVVAPHENRRRAAAMSGA